MSPALAKSIRRERLIKLIYFLGLVLGLLLSIVLISNMLVSMLLAFVTFYMLSPLVDWIEGRGLSRVTATSIPFLVLSLVVVILSVAVSPKILGQIQSIQENSQKYIDVVVHGLQEIESKLNLTLHNIYPVDIRGQVEPFLISWAAANFKKLPEILSQSVTVMVMAPFLAFYMLLDGRDIIRKILGFVPNHLFELTLNLNDQIGGQLGGFIRARLIETFFISLLTVVGLMIIDFPYALILGTFAGIMHIIPYVGPFIAAVPAILISVANEGGMNGLIGLAIVFSVVLFIDNWILVPFLVAKIVDLHAVTVVVVVIAGAQVAGVLGMIISIPLVSVFKVSFLAIYQHLIDFRD